VFNPPLVRAPVKRAVLRRAIAAIVVATALSAHAQPQEPLLPADATLTRLVDESLAARPELAQAQAVVQAQAERIPQAGALPDPMLQVGVQNDGFTSIEIGRMDTSFVSVMAAQTLPWPGKRDLQQEVAALGATAAKQSVERVRLSTVAEVRRAYLDLVLVRDRLALLDALEASWENSAGVARARYQAGDGAQSDMLRAQLELNRLKQRRIGQKAKVRSLVQAINRLRAHPLDEPIETSSHIRGLPALASHAGRFSVERTLARSPELAAAVLAITRADRAVALADKGSYPDLTVSAGVMIRGTLPPMWLVTVGGPVPLYAGSKQRRAVAESRALESAAEHEHAALAQVLRLRSEQRRTAFVALVDTVAVYEQGLLVQSEATTQSTLAQYKVGKVAFASVLEANAGFLADQEGVLEAIAAGYRILIAEDEVSTEETAMLEEGRP